MAAKRAFISFDYDHDESLKNLLAGQARLPRSPFEIEDWSIDEHIVGDWLGVVRSKIRRTDLTIVICGQYTNRALGVSEELRITREERHPYFLLAGHSDVACTKPSAALPSDKMYNWTWDNLAALTSGSR